MSSTPTTPQIASLFHVGDVTEHSRIDSGEVFDSQIVELGPFFNVTAMASPEFGEQTVTRIHDVTAIHIDSVCLPSGTQTLAIQVTASDGRQHRVVLFTDDDDVADKFAHHAS